MTTTGLIDMDIEELFSPDKIYLTTAAIAVVALFFVSVLAGISVRQRSQGLKSRARYRPRKRLMEGPEKLCFQLLVELFGEKFYVIPQVEVSALLNHKVGSQDRQTAKRFIENKTVDFVLCNKRSLCPICAVKLADPADKPVKKASRNPLDVTPQDLKKFFKSAHLPLVYLTKPETLNRSYLIDEFSKEVYETSRLGRARKNSKDDKKTKNKK